MALIPMVAAALLAGAPAPPAYLFVLDTDRRVGFYRDGLEHIGTLDAGGGFHETETEDVSRGGSVLNKRVGPQWVPAHLSGPYKHLKHSGSVFELRGEMLIRGTRDRNSAFTPDQNVPPARFEDYLPGPEAVPIWNLPGEFVRTDHLEARRKWFAEHMADNPVEYGKEKAKLDAAVAGKK
jgi:hypothetical protein